MICKKCKTALAETDKVCTYCGARVRAFGTRITGIALAIVTVGAIAVVIYSVKKPQPVEIVQTETIEKNEDPIAATASPSPTPEQKPVSNPDLSKEMEQIWNMVDHVAEATQTYYNKYNKQVQFISRNGFLYDAIACEYVQPKVLLDVTDIEEDYTKETVLVLYLKPDDILKHSNLNIANGENFEIFAAYETKDGYAISSAQSAGGMIAREDLKSIMDLYNCDHGEITRYTSDSMEFMDIQRSVLSYYPAGTSSFDVRYMSGDSKYAVTVLSPKGSTGRINMFVLVKEYESWKVIANNVETKSQRYVFLNNLACSMNLDMMPKYDLHNDLKNIKSDFSSLYREMLKEDIITADDGTLDFASGTDEFVYMELSGGKMFLGNYNYEKGNWMMHAVTDTAQAEQIMNQLSIMPHPPYYILKQY